MSLFISKGSPWENGYVESINGKLRDELLKGELFLTLEDARWVIDRWRLDYHHRASTVHWLTRPLPRMRPAVFSRLRLHSILQNTA